MTGQVVNKDKNGHESDIENNMFLSTGLVNTMKEMNSARSDDMVMKQQMLQDIALNGYTKLEDMDDNLMNKTTLNMVDTYFLGMSVKTDLVTKGLMVASEQMAELK